ncbi:MAG: 5-oxoprolinase, partial [Acidobacteriota bacterium]
IDDLADRARRDLLAEGVAEEEILIRRRVAFLRFVGQDATLDVDLPDDPGDLAPAFLHRYQARYGYRPPDRAIEIEALRVVASSRPDPYDPAPAPAATRDAEPVDVVDAHFEGGLRPVARHVLARLQPGERVVGPAVIFDDHASLALEPGWVARKAPVGSLVAERRL